MRGRIRIRDLGAEALQSGLKLGNIASYIADSGEGRRTSAEAIGEGIADAVLSLALQMRLASGEDGDYGFKLLSLKCIAFSRLGVKEQHENH
ncbi:MAG: hypothetical protein ACYDHM_13865 [Acidiferrobacterales bacterium]